jgi:hypothetical protein
MNFNGQFYPGLLHGLLYQKILLENFGHFISLQVFQARTGYSIKE